MLGEIVGPMLPATRAEALAVGARHYYTGKPCLHGHLDKRVATNGACAECMRMRQRERLQDPEHRKKHNAWALARQMKRLSDPELRKRIRDREKNVRNTEEKKARRKECDAARYTDPAYREKHLARVSQWTKDNAARANARCSARRATQVLAMPKWLNYEERKQICDLYAEAKFLSQATGVPHHVDHVVPLKHKKVCGLHVPWNLEVKTAHENQRKYNTFVVEEKHHAYVT